MRCMAIEPALGDMKNHRDRPADSCGRAVKGVHEQAY